MSDCCALTVTGAVTTLEVATSAAGLTLDATAAGLVVAETVAGLTVAGSVVALAVAAEGPQGPPGVGANTLAMEFEWNNAPTRTVGTIPGGCVVVAVVVGVLEAWAAAGSSAAVGTAGDPGAFAAAAQSDLRTAGEYETRPAAEVGAATAVVLSLVAGSGESAGRGFVVVSYQPLGD